MEAWHIIFSKVKLLLVYDIKYLNVFHEWQNIDLESPFFIIIQNYFPHGNWKWEMIVLESNKYLRTSIDGK